MPQRASRGLRRPFDAFHSDPAFDRLHREPAASASNRRSA
jgi:hypothetical protein